MTAKDGYPTDEVAEAVGATYRQLDYWARTGLITPSVSQAKGTGSARRYSINDAVLCRIVVVLGTANGRNLPRGGGLGGLVREALATGEAGWYLALPAGCGPIVTCEPEAVIAEAHTVVTLVDLDAIRHHVVAALRPAVARSASEPIPSPFPEAERGAAGQTAVGEVGLTPGCTTTNEEGAVGISHGAFATTH